MREFNTLPPNTDRAPVIAIVGAGIAGLTLAILLDRQGVDYTIFERAKEVRPLGSAMSLGANVVPLFKQLGLYEEFIALGKVWPGIKVFDKNRQYERILDITAMTEMAGDSSYIFARPALYELLLKQIPPHRLHLGKRVLTYTQSDGGVLINTSDNMTHEADILIGADGAHSAVRQGLYRDLKAKGLLPPSDNVPLPFSTVCLVGQTTVLDTEEFPLLKLDEAQFSAINDESSPFGCSTYTTKQNTMCWMAVQFLDEESSKLSDGFRNSEWGPEAAEQMSLLVRDVAIPGAAPGAKPLTMGDLIDRTPKDLMSKVMLEEKVFETWHSGRTVLIGDACHKVSPAGGQGAINAIHDAIAIANWISVLPSTKLRDVERAFYEYREERHPPAKESYKSSQTIIKMAGTGFEAKILKFISNHMPNWLWRIALGKMAAHRPQASFLPLVEDKGTVPAAYQASLEKTLEIAKKQRKAAGAVKSTMTI